MSFILDRGDLNAESNSDTAEPVESGACDGRCVVVCRVGLDSLGYTMCMCMYMHKAGLEGGVLPNWLS